MSTIKMPEEINNNRRHFLGQPSSPLPLPSSAFSAPKRARQRVKAGGYNSE